MAKGLLEGGRAVVTGGGSGIGRATARRMVEEGSRVAVIDVDGEAAQRCAEEIGATAHQADVTDPDGLRAAVDEASEAMGGITILFNNAGIGNQAPLHGWEPAEWERLMAVNLTGVYLGFRAAIPHLPRRGRRERGLHRVDQRRPAGRRRGALCRGQGGRGRAHRRARPWSTARTSGSTRCHRG